jgi:hypothetical protein
MNAESTLDKRTRQPLPPHPVTASESGLERQFGKP